MDAERTAPSAIYTDTLYMHMLLPNMAQPAAGDAVRIMWPFWRALIVVKRHVHKPAIVKLLLLIYMF